MRRLSLAILLDGGLAQLARAPALQAGGQRFESVILHDRGPHGGPAGTKDIDNDGSERGALCPERATQTSKLKSKTQSTETLTPSALMGGGMTRTCGRHKEGGEGA